MTQQQLFYLNRAVEWRYLRLSGHTVGGIAEATGVTAQTVKQVLRWGGQDAQVTAAVVKRMAWEKEKQRWADLKMERDGSGRQTDFDRP